MFYLDAAIALGLVSLIYFGIFRPERKPAMTTRTGSIYSFEGGAFALYNSRNDLVGTYARRRDAVRGANRRGIALG